MNLIAEVEKGSIAQEIGIEKGDLLLKINGQEIIDVLDYRYLIQNASLKVLIKKSGGEEWLLEIEKEEYEDLGLVFPTGLMDKEKSCKNKCIFCFIDQLPKGLRETLYFKDDDSRLSFFHGNYLTLTNLTETDIDRIIFYRLSPINISVHATDPEVRQHMLKNPKATSLMPYLKKLYDAGISMNFQIVVCVGINDGAVLDETISALSEFMPVASSLSVVPVGLTRYREGLYHLEPFSEEDAKAAIVQVEGWQEKFKESHGTAFVFAADELYIKAGYKIPAYSAYEDFPQIENGVGMLAEFGRRFNAALRKAAGKIEPSNTINKEDSPSEKATREFSVVTGELAYPFISRLCKKLTQAFPHISTNVYCIKNDFFGDTVTVTGLLTGGDIFEQLKDKSLGETLFLPQNALRQGEDIFLDDLTLDELSQQLNIKIKPIKNGTDFVKGLLQN